jgi:hypothetical protein
MQRTKNRNVCVIVLIFLAVISGCSYVKNYGKLRHINGEGMRLTIQDLEENWNDYVVYYAGYYGSLSIKHPSAIMFDPRNDSRQLVGDKWTKVTDKTTLSELISSIQSQQPIYYFYPRLWRILGPDEQLYGFLFTSWDHVVAKVIGEKIMWVDDLPSPPYLSLDGNEVREFIPGN